MLKNNKIKVKGVFMGNVFVLDNGLVCAHQQYEKKLNWNDALLYCSLLIIDGYDDWRMPTILELQYVIGMSRKISG